MEVREQKNYLSLKTAIDEADKNKANLLIVTLPGTGMGRFLKEYEAERGLRSKMKIWNYDWEKEEDAIADLDQRMKELAVDEKVVLTINYPGLLEDKRLATKSWWNHFYQRYYFGVRDEEDGVRAIKEMKPGITETEAKRIYKMSGGLGQVMKYLAVNGEEAREGLEVIITPIIKAILTTSEEIRQRLGWKTEGTVLEEYLKGKEWSIKVDFELNVIEEGQKGGKLTPVEAEVLTKMINSEGKITKEEIAEIKWGKEEYEEFSDQAINKTMRRIDGKLKKYQIETIPKVGFVLRKR